MNTLQPGPDLHSRIEVERRRLQKASAILTCATWAARHDVETSYDDIMSVVVDMIDAAVNALDSVELSRAGRTGDA